MQSLVSLMLSGLLVSAVVCGTEPWTTRTVQPAAPHEMGFTHVKAMVVPTNLKTGWIDKGYPTDKRAE